MHGRQAANFKFVVPTSRARRRLTASSCQSSRANTALCRILSVGNLRQTHGSGQSAASPRPQESKVNPRVVILLIRLMATRNPAQKPVNRLVVDPCLSHYIHGFSIFIHPSVVVFCRISEPSTVAKL